MGNCASARRKEPTSRTTNNDGSGHEKHSAATSTLVARDNEINDLRHQLNATSSYAQSIAHEASTLRRHLHHLEAQKQSQHHDQDKSARTLPDGTIIRPIIPDLSQSAVELIRQHLHEFLMWEKDEGVEKCRYLHNELSGIGSGMMQLERKLEEDEAMRHEMQGALEASEMERRRAEEEIDVLRRELARSPTPTAIGDVGIRVLGNIEAIRNGTWKKRERRKSGKTIANVVEEDDERNADFDATNRHISSVAFASHQATSLEQQLSQKTEAFSIQERLVQSLMRERDDLRSQIDILHGGSSKPTNSTNLKHPSNNIPPSRHLPALITRSDAHDPNNDSAIDIESSPPCLDCEDLRAEIWNLSHAIVDERAATSSLHRECIEAREDAERVVSAQRDRVGRYRRKVQILNAEMALKMEEMDALRGRLRKYKAHVRRTAIGGDDARNAAGTLKLRIQLSKAHARIVELAAAKEQAENKVLLQQRELRETRRLAMRQSRRTTASTSNGC